MKKIFLIVGLCILLLDGLRAQETVWHFDQTSLESIFKSLEKQHKITFAYDYDLIASLTVPEKKYSGTGIEELLDQLLSPLGLTYRFTDQNYVLILKHKDTPSSSSEEEMVQICGYLTDEADDRVLSYANIALKGTTMGTTTDETGFFSLSISQKPVDTLMITYVGYQPYAIPVQAFLGRPCLRLQLTEAGMSLVEVLIRDYAISFLKPSRLGQGIELRPADMGRLPGWGENDILRMVQLLPGIHSSNESAADIHIRGGTPDQNLILWEDIPILHIGHFFGLFTAVNPNIVQTIKVYPGNFDASQGGRVSGLIDMRGPDPGDSLSGQVSLNLINAQAYLNLPVIKEKASLQLAVRRSYTDIIQSPTYKKLFDQVAGNGKIEENEQQISEQALEAELTPSFYFFDLNAKWQWNFDEQTSWTTSFYRGSDRLDYQVLFDAPTIYFRARDQIELGNTGASTSLQHRWSHRLSSNLKWIFSSFKNRYDFSLNILSDFERERDLRFFQNNNMQENGLQWNNSWSWRPGQTLNFGYHRSAYQADFEVAEEENDRVNTYTENIRGTLHSLYLDWDLNINDRLLVDFGLRHIRYAPYESFLLLPRLSVNYTPVQGFPLQIKSSIGRYAQFVNQMITDNDLGLSEQIWIIAGEGQGLPLVQSNQWSAGLRLQQKGWIIDAEYYEKETFNLTSLNLRLGSLQDNPFSVGQADIRGFDVLVRKKWRHFNSWLSWSVGEVRYRFPTLNNGEYFFADHDQRHTINWTNILEYPNWGVSLGWHYNTGRPYTRPSGVDAYYMEEGDYWDYDLRIPVRNDERLPAYQRIDLSVYGRWDGRQGERWMTGISIFNLFGHRNVRERPYYIIPPDPSAQQGAQLFFYDRPALGFTPNVFVEFQW